MATSERLKECRLEDMWTNRLKRHGVKFLDLRFTTNVNLESTVWISALDQFGVRLDGFGPSIVAAIEDVHIKLMARQKEARRLFREERDKKIGKAND